MKRIWLIPTLIVVVIAFFASWIFVQNSAQLYVPIGGQPKLAMKAIQIGSAAIFVEVASTTDEQTIGFSGRTFLPQNSGMLFVFPEPVVSGFWMKDMQFSLDIIWADENGTILTIYKDLPPNSYPNIFRPVSAAKYVLEVPAGFTASHSIVVGDKIVL